MDTSWWLRWHDTSIIIDPWLIGSEIDGFKWFNEQWHATEPVPIKNLPPYDAILISQSYADHCHRNTLLQLPEQPIFSVPKAYKVIKGWKLPNVQSKIEHKTTIGNLKVHVLPPDRKIDPIYYAVLISEGNDAVLYASHGFTLTKSQLSFLEGFNIRLLITTLTEFKLPALLGGKVNPGMENVEYLMNKLKPNNIINTHDEEKIARGLVSKLAKVTFPDYDNIPFANFLRVDHYNELEIS